MMIYDTFSFILSHLSLNGDPEYTEASKALSKAVRTIESSPAPMTLMSALVARLCPNIADAVHIIAHNIDNTMHLPYHNSAHHAKVVFFAALLGKHQFLSEYDMETLLLTASLHDYNCEPNIARRGDGQMEKKSIVEGFALINGEIKSAESSASIANHTIDDIKKLNLATVFPAFRNHGYHDASPRSLEVILSDADMIGSCGIDFEQYLSETSNIEREGGFILDNTMRLKFLKSIGQFKSAENTLFDAGQLSILARQTALA